jgi:hypothetical protein
MHTTLILTLTAEQEAAVLDALYQVRSAQVEAQASADETNADVISLGSRRERGSA